MSGDDNEDALAATVEETIEETSASLDEDMSGDDNEHALASTVDETVEETSACVPDGDCLVNPETPKLPEYYYCCSKTGHWTERCNSKSRCGAADVEDSQYAFALV
jgi:hypothetical protein